ncbi:hypothetical protein Sango_1813300 [Sesamum angolense]|uniref:Uncharacterized protein n=1 Tax=Sesamum angolense TaxID=2727404 RepID=A0AAE2BQ59_9LAMI|nr:hypothetical protein Sango_1813300 [Sesamum angolense]
MPSTDQPKSWQIIVGQTTLLSVSLIRIHALVLRGIGFKKMCKSIISHIDFVFYSLLKSRFECADFLKELENGRASLPQNMDEEGNSWDLVSKNDLWGGADVDLDTEDYVLVQQEDIIEGIAFFTAAYLLSLEQTKHLTPNQLQAALSKTFRSKRRKHVCEYATFGTAFFNFLKKEEA